MSIRKWIDRSVSLLWAAVIVLVVTVAVYVALGRQIFAYLPDYKSHVELILSERLKMPVSIHGIKGDWNSLAPSMTITGLALKPHGILSAEYPYFQQASITVDMLASLRNLKPILGDLRVYGLNLTVTKGAEGNYTLRGFDFSRTKSQPSLMDAEKKKSDTKVLLDLLLKQKQIRFSNVHLRYIEPDLERVLIARDLHFSRVGQKNYLQVDVQLSRESGAALTIKAEGKIDPFNFEEAYADIYVSVDGEDVSRWIPESVLNGYQVNHLTPEVAVWGRLDEGRLQNVQGKIYFNDVEAVGVNGELPLIRQLGGSFFWKSIARDQWQLAVNRIRWEQQGTDINEGRVYVSYLEGDGGFSTLDAQISELDIQPLADIALGTNALSESLRSTIADLSPKGQLENIAVSMVTDSEQQRHFNFSLDFQQLNISPWKKAPGISGLSGRIIGSPKSGVAELWSDGAVFDWPAGMPEPIAGSYLRGVVDWQMEANSVVVRTGNAIAHADDATGAVMATVTLPINQAPAEGEEKGSEPGEKRYPDLDLIATVLDGKGSKVKNYLPKKVPTLLTNWLVDAVVDGQLLEGSFIYRGPLKVPRKNRSLRTFQMRFIAEEAELKFLPDWPPLTEGIAEIFVNEGYTEGDIFRGKIYGAEIKQARIEVPFPRKTPVPVLFLKGDITGAAEDGLRLLQETPLEKNLGGFIHDVEAQGDLVVNVDLSIPLAASDLKVETDVDVSITDGQYKMPSLNLVIDDVSGAFRYSRTKGLFGNELSGNWQGYPIAGNISSLFQGPNWIDTVISVSGNTSVAALQDWSNQWVLDFLEGDFAFDADLHFFTSKAGPDDYSYLEVRSGLEGVSLDLPFPYGKTAEESRSAIFRMSLNDLSSKPMKIDLLYDELMSASMLIDPLGIERAMFTAGGTEWQPVIEKPGIHASGYIESIDFDEWASFFTAISESASRDRGVASADKAELEESAEDKELRSIYDSIGLIDIYTNRLNAFSLELIDLNLQTMFTADEWYVNLQNENLSALLRIPQFYSDQQPDFAAANPWSDFLESPISADVHYLKVPEDPNFFFADKGTAATADPLTLAMNSKQSPSETIVEDYKPIDDYLVGVDPRIVNEDQFRPNWLPPVEVRLHNLWLQEEAWGNWSTRLIPLERGLRLSDVEADFRSLNLSGEAFWSAETGGQETTTQFTGKATTKDVAKVMKHFGYEPTVQSEAGVSQMDLTWAGSPVEFDLSTVDGGLTMALDKGYLLSVDPAASSVRVLGLLNFDTLQRRLQFDFKDIYKKGLAYDRISGDFQINESVLSTSMVKIRGPSTKMDIQGDVNVDTGKVDQELTLTLPIAKNLVIPAGAVGGLPAAATAFVIEKALGDQLDKLTTVRFKIEGNLEDPQVTEVKYFR